VIEVITLSKGPNAVGGPSVILERKQIQFLSVIRHRQNPSEPTSLYINQMV
jgi:hypothetical protein